MKLFRIYVVIEEVEGISTALYVFQVESSKLTVFQSLDTSLCITFQSVYSIWKGKYVENTLDTVKGLEFCHSSVSELRPYILN